MKYEFFPWVFLDRVVKTSMRAPSLRASKVLVSAPKNCSARSENGLRFVLEDVKRGSMLFILKFSVKSFVALSSNLAAVPLRSCLIETSSLTARNEDARTNFFKGSVNENVLEICVLRMGFHSLRSSQSW